MVMPEFQQLVNEARKEIQEIEPADLKRMRQSGEDFILLDVREPDEVARGTISGAIPIPRGLVDVNIDRVTTDKDKKLVLYCGGGSRSALAAGSGTGFVRTRIRTRNDAPVALVAGAPSSPPGAHGRR